MAKTFDEILATWTTAEEFMASAAFVCDTKAKADRVITHLAASAIKLALDELAAGRAGTSVEANGLLWYCLQYRKKEAQMLRAYILNYGPFVAAPDVVSIDIAGQKCVLEKGTAVRFNKAKAQAKFSEKSPEEYARIADAVQFSTWKAAMKAETSSTKEDGTPKSDEEKTADAKKKLQARLDRALKDAKEQGITLDFPSPVKEAEPETVIVRQNNVEKTFNAVMDLLAEVRDSDTISDEERIILDDMCILAAKMMKANKDSQKKAA